MKAVKTKQILILGLVTLLALPLTTRAEELGIDVQAKGTYGTTGPGGEARFRWIDQELGMADLDFSLGNIGGEMVGNAAVKLIAGDDFDGSGFLLGTHFVDAQPGLVHGGDFQVGGRIKKEGMRADLIAVPIGLVVFREEDVLAVKLGAETELVSGDGSKLPVSLRVRARGGMLYGAKEDAETEVVDFETIKQLAPREVQEGLGYYIDGEVAARVHLGKIYLEVSGSANKAEIPEMRLVNLDDSSAGRKAGPSVGTIQGGLAVGGAF